VAALPGEKAVKFETPRFGHIEVDGDKIVRFENGMPGFPDCTQFIVMDHDRETPLKWLQCVDRPEVAFLVVEPEQVLSTYTVEVPESVLRVVQWEKGSDVRDVSVFVILNVENGELTANLRAPVVVNIKKRLAFQMILDNLEIPLRMRIEPEIADAPLP
jgi:flagellar assembly factor FliW